MSDQVTLLLGTTKGAFLLSADADRTDWSLSGPHCDGWSINHVVGDPETGHLWAGGGSDFVGAGVWRSTDGGGSWTLSCLAHGQMEDWIRANPDEAKAVGFTPSPPAPFTGEISAIWSVNRSHGRVYAGAKPATLLVSDDDGETWRTVRTLSEHPSRDSWHPGGAGLILHSIVSDPADAAKLWLGISAAGVFATEDGGQTWDRRNRRSNTDGAGRPDDDGPGHDHGGEVGHCVHNFVRAAGSGDVMYQQNHHGVFRSADGGRSWHEITAGLPSGFGFPVAVDPADPRRIWVLPLNGDIEGRFPPGASAAVWRSDDGGETWQAGRDGLPAENCFFTVLRQAMATDRISPTGLYFGTNSGSVFASLDHGDRWREIASHLPTILSVETLTAPA